MGERYTTHKRYKMHINIQVHVYAQYIHTIVFTISALVLVNSRFLSVSFGDMDNDEHSNRMYRLNRVKWETELAFEHAN